MLDTFQFTKDVLSLVDSNPRNNVEMSEIIEKYTAGQEKVVQQEIRRLMCAELIILKKADEIDYIDSEMTQLNQLSSFSFISNSLKIKSTYERYKKSGNEELTSRINELTLEALQRDKDNAALKKQLDKTLLKLSEAQRADIPINAIDRKTQLTWAIIAAIIGWLGFLYQLLKS